MSFTPRLPFHKRNPARKITEIPAKKLCISATYHPHDVPGKKRRAPDKIKDDIILYFIIKA